MKVYKLEVLVIDHDDVGRGEVMDLIENNKYLWATVMHIEGAEIGEWHDGHPLNMPDTIDDEYKKLFTKS